MSAAHQTAGAPTALADATPSPVPRRHEGARTHHDADLYYARQLARKHQQQHPLTDQQVHAAALLLAPPTTT